MTNKQFNKAVKGITIPIVKNLKGGEMLQHNDDYYLYSYELDEDHEEGESYVTLREVANDEEIAVLCLNLKETQIIYQMLI
jgi:hypothetical protein|tara:strand:+ start:261 stop:503 length:243 start_codon:yes stop_codon:yes gene_type:complete